MGHSAYCSNQGTLPTPDRVEPDYCRRGGILLGIDGVGPPEAVTERILASLWVR
ncbi:MAG: hypothetical protein M0Z40_15450 [Actinomycetota bacterium]|nr:hypothetical protein [Actinomycetota bacterium]